MGQGTAPSAPARPGKGLGELFALPGYRAFFASRVLTVLARAFSQILLLLEAARLSHGSPAAVAGVWAVTYLPNLLGGPLVGYLVDRSPKRALMQAASLGQAAVLVGFALHPSLWGVWVAVALATLCQDVYQFAQAALQPEIAGGLDLSRVVAMSRSVTDGVQILGYAVSGVVLVLHFLTPGLIGAGLLLAAGAAALQGLPARMAGRAPGTPQGLWRATLEGARAVWVRPKARQALSILVVAALGASVGNAVLVLVPADIAHVPLAWYSALEAVQSMVMLGFGLVLAAGHRLPDRTQLGLSLAAVAVGVAGLALSPRIGPDFAWNGLIGVGNIGLVVVLQPRYREAFPLAVRGRAVALSGMVQAVSRIAGTAAGGLIAQMAGVQADLLVAAAMIGLVGAGVLALPGLVPERSMVPGVGGR